MTPTVRAARGEADAKQRTAALSVISNSSLILLKVIAGTLTGSVAILTEAIHSSIDLVASIVAYFSVRKADEPADESHRYGHEKIENIAAAIEGILILVGSAAIAFAAIRRLVNGGSIHTVGLGIAVVALSIVVNLIVSTKISRTGTKTGSPALEGDAAHLRTDALSSAAVLLGLTLVQLTGAEWLDPVVALGVAGVIVFTGVKLVAQSTRSSRPWPHSPTVAWSDTTSCARAAPAPGATSTCTFSFAPGRRSRTPTARHTTCRI